MSRRENMSHRSIEQKQDMFAKIDILIVRGPSMEPC